MTLFGAFEQLVLFRSPKVPAAKVRHAHLGNRLVPYELRQKGVRRLSMTIDERGLRVSAPQYVSLAEIERFLRDNTDWILRKLDEYAHRGRARHLRIRDGVDVPILGEELRVRVIAGANRVFWEEGGLILAARGGADLDALAKRGLQRRALDHFRRRVGHYAQQLGLPAPAVALTSARTRWGSCSRKTGIRLNWRLIHLPPALVDYVVAHEVAHLVEMNHSPRFWAVVESLDPGWQEARAELKRRAPEIPLV